MVSTVRWDCLMRLNTIYLELNEIEWVSSHQPTLLYFFFSFVVHFVPSMSCSASLELTCSPICTKSLLKPVLKSFKARCWAFEPRTKLTKETKSENKQIISSHRNSKKKKKTRETEKERQMKYWHRHNTT